MILRITDNNECLENNVYCVNIESLQNKGVHIYLASKTWDVLEIELDDRIPKNFLRYLVKQCKKVIPILNGDISQHQTSLLCEMFPERAGKIRSSVIKTGGVPNELLC